MGGEQDPSLLATPEEALSLTPAGEGRSIRGLPLRLRGALCSGVALAKQICWARMVLPVPGAPARMTREPGSSPPPRMRSSSGIPDRSRFTSLPYSCAGVAAPGRGVGHLDGLQPTQSVARLADGISRPLQDDSHHEPKVRFVVNDQDPCQRTDKTLSVSRSSPVTVSYLTSRRAASAWLRRCVSRRDGRRPTV